MKAIVSFCSKKKCNLKLQDFLLNILIILKYSGEKNES